MPEVSNYSRGIFFRKVRSSYSLLSVFSEGLFVLMKRPEFLRMIEDSKKKIFDYVLVYQLDRFARNRYDSANYKAKLKKNGVRVLSAKEKITEDASGILIEGVLESMAEYYSAECFYGHNISKQKEGEHISFFLHLQHYRKVFATSFPHRHSHLLKTS